MKRLHSTEWNQLFKRIRSQADVLQFQYQPLRYCDAIRLLRLQPTDNPADNLAGSLVHTTISECTYNLIEPYTALSYCWGGRETSCKIYLDGCVFSITTTLDAALRDLRDRTHPRRIWADALCINQSDYIEKSYQVSMMGDIYRAANHTIIHLNLPDPEIHALFARSQPRLEAHNIFGSVQSLDSHSAGHDHGAATEVHNLEVLRQNILGAEWFTRAWVFQELVLSQDPWVQCGPYRASWVDICNILGLDHVIKAMRFQIQDINSLSQSKKEVTVLNPFSRMNERQAEKFAAPLSTTLYARRGTQATDPRDLIFANLGIVSDLPVCHKYITVDYNRPVEAVFNDVARYLVEISDIDLLFYHALFYEPGLYDSKLPAWVPDWTSARLKPFSPPLRRPNNHYPLATSINGKVKMFGVHSLTIDNPVTLCVTGRQLEVIKTLSLLLPHQPVIEMVPSYKLTRHDLSKFLQDWRPDDPHQIEKHHRFCDSLAEGGLDPPLWRGWLDEQADSYLLGKPNNLAQNRLVLGAMRGPNANTRETYSDPEEDVDEDAPGHRSVFIVPPQTQENDILVEVGPSCLILVLRPVDRWVDGSKTDSNEIFNRNLSIQQAFHAANGAGTVPIFAMGTKQQGADHVKEVGWDAIGRSFQIGHYRVVGECIGTTQFNIPLGYGDHLYDMFWQPPTEEMGVFALY
ncbi:heterokaryon incompatibility protein-domain-containing protein [Cercophora samala]|uniref:Heterokaryon incompatibility protein-domain-containing protein n=1 Tax=Cercophora samala TaxID=330535 RepID=A0AA40DBG9_9PEZI|nr:heterokaryon incompatibility protein-domain-containing protein [Cercophora samala]